MAFRLVDKGWAGEIDAGLQADRGLLRVICPFIKRKAAQRLLARGAPEKTEVITRFNLCDFCNGVSDTSALRLLLEHGATIRGVRGLHAKLYLFGRSRVILTSANLTDAALLRNHEFGCVADDAITIASCHTYFEELWKRAGRDLVENQVDQWDGILEQVRVQGARPSTTLSLPDEGAKAKFDIPEMTPPLVADAGQSFVKFFGESHRRRDRHTPVFDEVKRSGCHWACTYPRGKRPRAPKDGAILFMGRMVNEPNDTLIYGRAIGEQHQPGRDDATPEDIAVRSWKTEWPHYIRVHHAEFLSGDLTNGISLNALMIALGSDSFLPTQRNAQRGSGNTDPRQAYKQQAAVELTPQAAAWLNSQLDSAFLKYGRLTAAQLETLDWPEVPVTQ